MHPLLPLGLMLILALYWTWGLWSVLPMWTILKLVGPLLGIFVLMGAVWWVLARVWGWNDLVNLFPDAEMGETRKWRYRDLRFGSWSGYNGLIKIEANALGLRFSMPWPFHLCNRPFCIPWAEVAGIEEHTLLRLQSMIRFSFNRTTITISLAKELAKEILREMPRPLMERNSGERASGVVAPSDTR